MKAKDKILKAKIHLQKTNPFFAYLVMNLTFIEDSKITNTMGVDNNGNCYYDSKFIDKLEQDDLESVLAHEVLHIILEHLTRGKNLEIHELANVSADMVVNDLLVTNGFSFPHFDNKKYINLIPYNHSCEFMGISINELDKKSFIQVYWELYDKLKKKGKIQKIKYNGFDKHIKDKNQTKEKIKANKEKWKRAVGSASAYARERGKMTSGLGLLVDELLNEKVNWKQLLYRYITKTLPFDYTYSRPSKKSVSCGVYLPSILRESIEIVVSLDTSGSIDKEELTEFLSEINSIAKSFNNINMKLIVCDSEIKDVYEIGNGHDTEISKLKIRGGGGTSHKPIYDYLNKELPNTRFVINFTDGYTEYPIEEEVKTLWVICKNGIDESRIKWGEVIKLS